MACHAHAAETLLRGSWIRKVSFPWLLGLFLLSGAAGGFFFVPGVALRWALVGLVGAQIALAVCAHWLFVSFRLWLPVAAPAFVVLGQFVAGAALQKVYEGRRNAFVTGLFGKYVSPAVAADILDRDLDRALSGQRREVSILFSDLRGFTSLSERLGAVRTTKLLNTYFGAMLPLVFQHQGTLDKLMGDAVMAFFGAPAKVRQHPVCAAQTALAMVEALSQLKRRGEPDAGQREVGIGVHTGEATVGNLGSADFMDYTIVGDAVNLASRLEGLNKVYETRVIVSEFTARRLDERFVLRELDRVRVKGRAGAVTIFELAGLRQAFSPAQMAALKDFEARLGAFRRRQWDRAEGLFAGMLKRIPADGPARCYLKRIDVLKKQPPPSDWDGVMVYTEK